MGDADPSWACGEHAPSATSNSSSLFFLMRWRAVSLQRRNAIIRRTDIPPYKQQEEEPSYFLGLSCFHCCSSHLLSSRPPALQSRIGRASLFIALLRILFFSDVAFAQCILGGFCRRGRTAVQRRASNLFSPVEWKNM